MHDMADIQTTYTDSPVHADDGCQQWLVSAVITHSLCSYRHVFAYSFTNFLDGLLNALSQRRDFQAHSCACLHIGDAICALPLQNRSMSHIIQLHNIVLKQ